MATRANMLELKNPDAEQYVLSCLMSKPNCLYSVADVLPVDAFALEANRALYETVLALAHDRKPIDLLLVVEELKARGMLNRIGGVAYVTQVYNVAPTAANVMRYVETILEYYRRRCMVDLSAEIEMAAMDGAALDLDEIQRKLSRISLGGSEEISSMADALIGFHSWMDERAKSPMTGVLSGIAPIDLATRGWQKTDLIILAARPAMGKTAMALNFVRGACKEGKSVLLFSLEMSREQILSRLVSAETKISGERIFAPSTLTEGEWGRILEAENRMAKWRLMIDDKGGITPMQMYAKARNMQGKAGLDLVILDYLQLLGTGKERRENRTQEIGYISRSLKMMAKDLNVPVVALSQLSRDVEKRVDKRPMLSDMRDGGTIEQDADMIITLYRDSYYNPKSEDNITEFDIKKFRNGRARCINLLFHPETMTFTPAGGDFGGETVKEVPW